MSFVRANISHNFRYKEGGEYETNDAKAGSTNSHASTRPPDCSGHCLPTTIFCRVGQSGSTGFHGVAKADGAETILYVACCLHDGNVFTATKTEMDVVDGK